MKGLRVMLLLVVAGVAATITILITLKTGVGIFPFLGLGIFGTTCYALVSEICEIDNSGEEELLETKTRQHKRYER